jgi:hypothetical protein
MWCMRFRGHLIWREHLIIVKKKSVGNLGLSGARVIIGLCTIIMKCNNNEKG